jgi:polyhydroxyalkanoate synthesis repressor PhaR
MAPFRRKEIDVNPGSPSTADGGTSHEQCEASPRVIKRYVNRKLYDTVESRYVTLDEIAHMVKLGDDVKVVEERTENDLTGVTLLQIILEEQRRSARVPTRLLSELIRNGASPVQPAPERRAPDAAEVRVIRDGAEQRLHCVVERGQQANDRAKEMLAASQQAVLELQRRMNERVGAAFEVVAAVGKLKRELAHIIGRIEYLDERLQGIREEPRATVAAASRRPELRSAP